MHTLRIILWALLLGLSAGRPIFAEESVSEPGGGHMSRVPPVDLSLSVHTHSDGAGERMASLSSGAHTLLFRDRVRPDTERERVVGYESLSVSAGPLQSRGYLRSIEAPLSGSPVRDGLSDAGGYRLRRQGGYGDTPDLALRFPFAAAHHRDTDEFVLTGASFDMAIGGADRERNAGDSLSGGVHTRLFAARSTPGDESEPSQWLPDSPSGSSGPLWFSGFEMTAGPVRAELIGVGGARVSPGWLAGLYLQGRVGRGELRGSLQGRSSRFIGANGQRPDRSARAGVRYERSRGAFLRPLVQSVYYLGARETLPGSYRRDGIEGALATAIGPTTAFLRPRFEARLDRDSAGDDRTRLTARVDGALGGEAARITVDARRHSDSDGPGRSVVSAGARIAGFAGRVSGHNHGARGRAFAGFGRAAGSGNGGAAEVWQFRAETRVRAVGYDPEEGKALSDHAAAEDWKTRLRGSIGVERAGFNVTLVLVGDDVPVDDLTQRMSRSATAGNLEGELRVRWRTSLASGD